MSAGGGWAASVAVLAAMVMVAAVAVALPAQPRPFRSGVDLVTLPVTVNDRKGALVPDLTAADFEVREDGVVQRVQFFAQGLREGEGPATHLGVMLDTSASMESDLKLARSAAIKFLNLLPEAADITLVDFDNEVRVTRYPARDFARLVERIRMRKPAGWTALYDALGMYLHGARDTPGRTVLVMYTDGADSRSTLDYREVLDLLRASHVTVYAVGLVENTGRQRFEVSQRLRQMVAATGGQVFFPTSLRELDAAYSKVIEEIRAQYQLGYLSTNTRADGTWRKVEITVRRAGVKARSRQGYFAR